MSSAILYLAIVAIWACVLIPRWLRRDSARGGSAPVTAEPTVPDEPEAGFADETQADADDAEAADEAPRRVSAGTAVSGATTAPRAESRFSHRGMSTQSQIAMIAR